MAAPLTELIPQETLRRLRDALAAGTGVCLGLFDATAAAVLAPEGLPRFCASQVQPASPDAVRQCAAEQDRLVEAVLAEGAAGQATCRFGLALCAVPVRLNDRVVGVVLAEGARAPQTQGPATDAGMEPSLLRRGFAAVPVLDHAALRRIAEAFAAAVQTLADPVEETLRQRRDTIRFQEELEERVVQQTAQLRSRNRELSALNSLSSALAETLEPERLLSILLEKALGVVSAVDAGVVFRWSEQTQRLLPAAALGVELAELAGVGFPPDEGPVGRSFHFAQPVFSLVLAQVQEALAELPKATLQELTRAGLGPKKLHQMTALPLTVREHKLGVAWFVDRRGGTPLTPEDLNLLRSMTNQTAVVLENARLYEESHRRAREAETFSGFSEKAAFLDNEQAMLQAAVQVLEQLVSARGGCVTLAQDGKVRVAEAWGGAAFLLGREVDANLCPALRRSKPMGPQQTAQLGRCRCPFGPPEPEGYYLCVPLAAMGHTLGGIHLFHPQPWAFDRDAEALVRRLADYLALAMENIRLLDHTRQQAITDALTGLHNFRFFQDYLVKQLAQADRAHSRLALLMMDLDLFKQVNDNFGHEAGDAVLQAFARTAEVTVRRNDLVARYGGEEFVAVLAGTGLEQGLKVADRIRAAAADCRVPLPSGQELSFSVSIGVAAYPRSARDLQGLFRAADLAMYRAKSRGRNRVESWVPPRASRARTSTA